VRLYETIENVYERLQRIACRSCMGLESSGRMTPGRYISTIHTRAEIRRSYPHNMAAKQTNRHASDIF